MYVEKAAETTFVQKKHAKNVDEINPWRGFKMSAEKFEHVSLTLDKL